MDDYVGEIRWYAGKSVRKGWVACEGQLLAKERYVSVSPFLDEVKGRVQVPDLTSEQPAPHVRLVLCTKGIFPNTTRDKKD